MRTTKGWSWYSTWLVVGSLGTVWTAYNLWGWKGFWFAFFLCMTTRYSAILSEQ